MEPTNPVPDADVATRQRRTPSFAMACIPLASLIVLLSFGYGMLGIRIEMLLLMGTAIAVVIGKLHGYDYPEMQAGINKAIHKSLTPILIVTVVGALIASWLASGTIQAIIYYGLQIISPAYFLISACIVCSIVSVMTGTSWGTVGTVGIALMGVAIGLGIDPAMAGGAIVAGAYFGDKISPFSDTTNLAPAATGSNIYDHIAHLLWTTVPAYLLGLLIYLYLGFGVEQTEQSETVMAIMNGIKTNYRVEGVITVLILMIPAMITLGAAILKKPVIPSMLISCAAAWLVAVTVQTDSLREIVGAATDSSLRQQLAWLTYPINAMILGYASATDVPDLDTLLTRGGMHSMLPAMLIALCAFGFAGVLTTIGALDALLQPLLKFTRRTGDLILAASTSSAGVAILTGSSFLSILIPGELFAKTFKDRGLAAKNLSRTVEDSGTVIVPLIPWSIAGVFMAGVLEVPTASYALYAFMCYFGIFFAIICGYTGIGIAPRKRDDETQPGS